VSPYEFATAASLSTAAPRRASNPNSTRHGHLALQSITFVERPDSISQQHCSAKSIRLASDLRLATQREVLSICAFESHQSTIGQRGPHRQHTMGRPLGEGLRSYYKAKIEELEIQARDKQHNLRRLEAQRNDLNGKGIFAKA